MLVKIHSLVLNMSFRSTETPPFVFPAVFVAAQSFSMALTKEPRPLIELVALFLAKAKIPETFFGSNPAFCCLGLNLSH